MAGDVVTIKSEQQPFQYTGKFIGADKDKYSSAIEYNVLHNYRSYNYVITLAALTRDQYNDPSFFKNNGKLQYVVLKSSGKGTQTVSASSFFDSAAATELNSGDLAFFNSNGYGRFDFFIDNIEIGAVWSMVNGSQPQTIRFEVFEPLGINGFTESIRVNAKAAGFENYFECPFALKIEFIGYKDGDGLSPPEVIPYATRVFPVNLNQVSLETSESGTKYRVACTSKNGMGLADDGKLATTAKMKGVNVQQVLKSLMEQITEARKKDMGEEENEHFNEYSIKFVDKDGNDLPDSNELVSAKINDELRDNIVYVFPSPADKDPRSSVRTANEATSTKYDPTEETVTFNSGVAIIDAISAVIRDSKYTEDLLGKLEEVKNKNNGLVPWFRVTVESEIKPGENPKTGALNYKYTYKVRPYMVHYSRLPGQGRGMFKADDLKGQIRRSYQYLYTGKNVDILNFNLKFDNLFYQQRPYNMGNRDDNGTAAAAGAPNDVKLKEGETPNNGDNQDQKPVKTLVSTAGSSITAESGVNGKAPQSNPYFKIGQKLHEALLDAYDFNVIDISLIGDPYYLVTTNVGNQEDEEDPSTPLITSSGQAPYLGGDVLIDLNFRTPRDIKPNGWVDFGEGLLPFSGIYRIQEITNFFKEGKFEQRIIAMRLSGQVVNDSAVVNVGKIISEPKEGSQQTSDTAKSSVPRNGSRASEANLLNLISRGLPTTGLPGVLSNFSNAVGGAIGGVNTSLQTTLQRVDSAVADALAPVNGVLQQAQAALNVAAQVGGLVAAGKALVNGFEDPGGAPGLGNPVSGYNSYSSGIRVNTDGLNDFFVGDSLKDQANVVSQSRIVSSFIQDTSNLRTLNQNYYNNVVSERIAISENKVSNAGNRIDEVTNSTPVDPKALAYKLGLDPAQLSGLSGEQQSNMLSQLLALANKIPENTDIAGLKALGISMKHIQGINIPNLPALQPLTLAPLANIPRFDLQKILAAGGDIKSLPGSLSLPGIAAFLALLNKEKSVPNAGIAAGTGPLTVQSTLDKIETAQSMSINLQSNSNFSDAQLNLGSIESNIGNVGERVQGYGGYYVISKTSYAQYGTQRKDSPIDKLMQTKI